MPKKLQGFFHAAHPVSEDEDPLPPPGFKVNMFYFDGSTVSVAIQQATATNKDSDVNIRFNYLMEHLGDTSYLACTCS